MYQTDDKIDCKTYYWAISQELKVKTKNELFIADQMCSTVQNDQEIFKTWPFWRGPLATAIEYYFSVENEKFPISKKYENIL